MREVSRGGGDLMKIISKSRERVKTIGMEPTPSTESLIYIEQLKPCQFILRVILRYCQSETMLQLKGSGEGCGIQQVYQQR